MKGLMLVGLTVAVLVLFKHYFNYDTQIPAIENTWSQLERSVVRDRVPAGSNLPPSVNSTPNAPDLPIDAPAARKQALSPPPPLAGTAIPVGNGDKRLGERIAAAVKKRDPDGALYEVSALRLDYNGYGVQVATYTDYQAILRHISQLEQHPELGQVYLIVNNASDQPLYKLVLGHYDTEEIARSHQKMLLGYGIKGHVVNVRDARRN